MRKVIQALYHLITTLISINRLNIGNSLKKEIGATWFKVFFLKRYDYKNRTSTILGFKVKFLRYYEFTYLFKEIFLDNEYYFVAGKKNPYIIDCGSNIGMSILYFKMLYPNSRIVAFEPLEETYFCLNENVKNNHLNSIVTHNVALSNRKGTIDLYYDKENTGCLRTSTKQERMPKQRRSVAVTLLSKHIDEDVDFLKIDIEGAELEVLEEVNSAGKLGYIKQMVIEYHHHVLRESDVFSKILRLLEDAGFGYQIESKLRRPLMREEYQDIIVYAYRKNPLPDTYKKYKDLEGITSKISEHPILNMKWEG